MCCMQMLALVNEEVNNILYGLQIFFMLILLQIDMSDI